MSEKQTTHLTHYLRLHWFKLCIIGLLLFVIFKKDFSFSIDLNNPGPTETTYPQAEPPQPVRQETPPKRETFTERGKQATTPTKSEAVQDRFDFSSLIAETLGSNSLADQLQELPSDVVERYVKRFGRVARSEQDKFGIPASITIANALLHSRAGQHDAAVRANNHFGLPCTTDWQGQEWTYERRCYRHYENAWTSFRDHSFYLTTGKFAPLRQLSSTDYRAWAKALAEKGFSEADDLAEQLISLIERLELHRLD